MPFHETGEIKYFSFTTFNSPKVNHAIFTRHGGMSPFPWESLNFGASVGDDKSRVWKNREIALSSINMDHDTVFDVYQVHGTTMMITDKPLIPGEVHQQADAIFTNVPGVTLMMRFADCVPILLYDPQKKAVGIVHAGWIGTVEQIAKKAVQKMVVTYGSIPEQIIAAIGPSIGPDHYIVGSDVVDKFSSSLGEIAKQCIQNNEGKFFLDLWKANQFILNSIGVNNIENPEICTCCNLSDWYSHRGEHGKTGRFGVVIGLNP